MNISFFSSHGDPRCRHILRKHTLVSTFATASRFFRDSDVEAARPHSIVGELILEFSLTLPAPADTRCVLRLFGSDHWRMGKQDD